MAHSAQAEHSHKIPSRVLHAAAGYDLLLFALSLGRERNLRRRILRLAQLAPGEHVLDIGCGTGTTALLAKELVGLEGSVTGVDASPEMVARANRKASRAQSDAIFINGLVEALPFPDAQFDVVLSSMMLHHLPADIRRKCAQEVRRVLKPGGRVLAVDFTTASGHKGLVAHFHRHGHISSKELVDIFRDAGLIIQSSGAAGLVDLHYVLASATT